MLPPPGPSAETIVTRKGRGEAFSAIARQRVLRRRGLTEADIAGMTDDEKDNSGLGREIMFEWLHSTFAKEYSYAEKRRCAEEDEEDVAKRVTLVMAANATAPFPYPPKKIQSLIRRRSKDIEDYSINMYSIDLFGYTHQTRMEARCE